MDTESPQIPEPVPRPGFWQSLNSSPLFRIMLLGILSLLLLIPLESIKSIVSQRNESRTEAVESIEKQWGESQILAGPFLVVPYEYKIITQEDKKSIVKTIESKIVINPGNLTVKAETSSEMRKFGLFEVPVYRSDFVIDGKFTTPQSVLTTLPASAVVHWPKAQMVMLFRDNRSLASDVNLQINGEKHGFESGGFGLHGLWSNHLEEGAAPPNTGSISATYPIKNPAADIAFSMPMTLNGSSALHVSPIARSSVIDITGNWPDPSFSGATLPNQRSVQPKGFTANWNVSHLSSGVRQVLDINEFSYQDLHSSRVGVTFTTGADNYYMAHRAIKYAQLFIVLTFAIYWLFEIVGGIRLHPVQYLLAGVGLCVFYLLQLALSEHLGFIKAYLLASLAVTAQITLYSRSTLKSWPKALVVGTAMASLYGYLLGMLQEQNYALVIGAVGVFIITSVVMWLTRKVEWGQKS